MKQKNILLIFALWATFSPHNCLSMELIEPQQLFKLAKNNSWNELNNQLTYYNGDINTTDNDPDTKGYTLLHLAILAGQVECVKTLIEKGADVTIETTSGPIPSQPVGRSWQKRISTPLHCAAQIGNIEIVNLLLNAGADINSTYNNFESTPLHIATWFCHPDCVLFLIKKGANMSNQNLAGSTPIHLAAWREKPECLRILIDKGAPFEDKNSTGSGNTPLYLAAKAGSLECLRILIKDSPDKIKIINLSCAKENKYTPIQMTVNRQKAQCFWDLFKNGADITTQLKENDLKLLIKDNEPLKIFIQKTRQDRTPRYEEENVSCFLCNNTYKNDDIILTLWFCQHSFHANCFENYALKKCAVEKKDALYFKQLKITSIEEVEFSLRTSAFGAINWNIIKNCPKCNKPTTFKGEEDLRGELSLFYK